MPALNFRLKLLLAMMVAVAGVSGATLFITQKKVQSAYEKVFKEKLEAQITYLPKEQEARLAAVKERCHLLVRKNVRLLAALREENTNDLYRVAHDELRKILRPTDRLGGVDSVELAVTNAASAEPSKIPDQRKKNIGTVLDKIEESKRKAAAKGLPVPPRARLATFVAFLDGEGKLLPDPAWDNLPFFAQVHFRKLMARVGSVVGAMTNQQVGYFDLPIESKQDFLLEVIATPVVDEVENKTVGALVLGFPFLDIGEKTINEVSDIENGIFLEGKLYSHTIQPATRAELTRLLPAEIKVSSVPRDDLIITQGGVPHRVFYTPLNPDSALGVAWKVGVYSWESALKAERELRTQIIGFSLLALLGALVLSVFLSHGLSVPLKELVGGTVHIRAGDFGIKVPVRSTDEIGQLARSFNEMAEGLALKEKYHDVLVKVTDKDVAQELLSGKVALGGELREVSVMFCDIRGFTAMTQNMDPADVIEMLNHHMTALTRIVNEHHGVVDKFIGDSIMALFGAPKSYGNDALNAAKCADAMQRERARLNETSHHKLHIGIGIATGEVLAGNMGSNDRSNYTVIGERVNLAARLCSVAERGEVVIGEFTREKLGELVSVEEMTLMKLKGFRQEVKAFRLLEVRGEKEPVKA